MIISSVHEIVNKMLAAATCTLPKNQSRHKVCTGKLTFFAGIQEGRATRISKAYGQTRPTQLNVTGSNILSEDLLARFFMYKHAFFAQNINLDWEDATRHDGPGLPLYVAVSGCSQVIQLDRLSALVCPVGRWSEQSHCSYVIASSAEN